MIHPMVPFHVEILNRGQVFLGILTPGLCQICRQGGAGVVTVRGLNGKFFSAHRWPCAEREGVAEADPP